MNTDIFYQLLSSFWSIFLIILFFGGSIFVHELGHFLAARRRGLKIERFSIGEVEGKYQGDERYQDQPAGPRRSSQRPGCVEPNQDDDNQVDEGNEKEQRPPTWTPSDAAE